MATTKEIYYTNISGTLVDYNDCTKIPLSNEKIRQAFSKVVAETEEEERDPKRNANNVTMDNFCNHYPVTTNTQGEITNVKKERRIS